MPEQEKKIYFFIDESGDPNFYGKGKKLLVGNEGYQPLLLIGMIETENRKLLRKSILEFQKNLEADPLFKSLHSIKPGWYLHAIEDHPDIRTKFVSHLRSLDGFRTFIVIGRKDVKRFARKHNNNPVEFYYDMLYHLLKDRLRDESVTYHLYLAKRQKTKMTFFEESVIKAIDRDNQRRKNPIKVTYKCDVVLSSEYPELSVIDYMLWSLQRYIRKNESRFYEALLPKYNLIIDLYDTANYSKASSGRSNYYNSSNIFNLDKCSEFSL